MSTELPPLEFAREARTHYTGSLAGHIPAGQSLANPRLRAERKERALIRGSNLETWVDHTDLLIEDGSVKLSGGGVEVEFWKAEMDPSTSIEAEEWRIVAKADSSDGEVIIGRRLVTLTS